MGSARLIVVTKHTVWIFSDNIILFMSSFPPAKIRFFGHMYPSFQYHKLPACLPTTTKQNKP